jgi:cytochrome c
MNLRHRALILAALSALAASTPALGQETLVRQGRRMATDDCSACHAVGERGASPSPRAPPFRDIVQRYDPDNLAEALAEGISVGHPTMPERVYPAGKIAALLAYLHSLQNRPHVRAQ